MNAALREKCVRRAFETAGKRVWLPTTIGTVGPVRRAERCVGVKWTDCDGLPDEDGCVCSLEWCCEVDTASSVLGDNRGSSTGAVTTTVAFFDFRMVTGKGCVEPRCSTGLGDGLGERGRSTSSILRSWRPFGELTRSVGVECLPSMSAFLGGGVEAGDGSAWAIAMATFRASKVCLYSAASGLFDQRPCVCGCSTMRSKVWRSPGV